MKRFVPLCAAIGLVMLIAACDSDTAPSDQSATFTVQLSPANEVPPVTNSESTGSGSAIIRLQTTRDSGGAITAATANFQVSLTGFPNGTMLTGAHIHRGNVGVAGPIVVDTGLAPGEVILTNGGVGSFTKNGVALTAALAQEILSTPSGFYLNVHTTLNGTGVARGQLVRQ